MPGLFGRIAAGLETKTTDITDLTWARLTGEDQGSKAGVAVNTWTTLRQSTALACGRVLAEGIAQLPWKLNDVGPDGETQTPARKNPLFKVLARRPNAWMTSFELRETMMLHALFAQDAYAYIGRGGISKQIIELIPLVPGTVTVERNKGYEPVYHVQGINEPIAKDSIFHLRGPSWDGTCGLNIIQLGRDALGLAIATEESHARLHANGVRPGGIISSDKQLSKPARTRLKEHLEDDLSKVRNAFRTLILDNGMKWQSTAQTGLEAQHIELRKFQIEEVCRFFRVFPQMVGYTDKTSTFASAESFWQAHVTWSLMPWVVRWEQASERDLLANADNLSIKMMVRQLLRGDAKTQAEFYASAIVNGWMTRNEARGFEELNRIDGLDEPLLPLNMGTAEDRAALQKTVTDTANKVIKSRGAAAFETGELETAIAASIENFMATRRSGSAR